MTYTYAILEVSRATFEEVARLLRAAGYDHAFDRDVIDMHGIALRIEEGDPNAEETGTDRGEGAGLLRDGAVRRGGAGAAAVPAGGEDAGAQGTGEGREANGAASGGGGDAERGAEPGPATAHTGAEEKAHGRGEPCGDEFGHWDGSWDDDGGASGTD